MKEVLTSKFPNCIYENSTLKIVNNCKDEYYSLRYGVALRIYNPVIIQMIGKDSLEFLHRVSTNDFKNLQPFQKKNTLFLNEKGRLIDRTTLLNLENKYFLIGLRDETNKLINWINKYIITEEIEINNISNEYLLIDVIGPQAESFLTLIVGEKLNELKDENFLDISESNLNFRIFLQKEKYDLRIYKILIGINYLSDFIDYVLDNKSIFDLNFVGEDSYNIFRVEMGLPDVTEINLNFNPHEIDLINEISFTKGCYIGQEVIARLDTYNKVQRKLCGIILNNDNCEFTIPAEIQNENGEDIGFITTTVNSELLKKKIGLAVIRKNYLEKNNCAALINNKKINFTITELPFSK
ncbi:YgfZ/GcvT domain-containing protein [Rosettibacter firmus]|uniref:CAF17-like 4Fe-4S cluster assembly/insertion protein YgfZ n=1 Tax=Rosettibacter firmus TaxID=3111522 RepID=UPI00336BC042